ncbi:hypothetical protein [Flagellimonas meridianipacifica]|uniref:Uncharacterized protein n=1 Tax=Flagellimonas meridianipacifica TaxID=1080225 RepID=A0A2T0MET4_9FLAO|nr:hypothetical protein [Allomuricauda pacifica]PRX56074.1 hypothetical protein CLV81_0062 [Allomuricauda pacifica]
MKISVMSLVAFTTLVLVTLVIMASMNFPFSWVFYVTIFGQGLVVFLVYRVLTEDYHTEKTFEHFYEDYPMDQE